MSTYINISKSDQRFFDELYPLAHPGQSSLHKRTIKHQLHTGQLNIPGLLETAISQVGHLTRVNANGMDFTDGSDAKKTTVRWHSNGKSFAAPVSRVHNKIGVLRVMCYNRQLDKFHYFLIPRSAYAHIDSTSNIEIPFMRDGTPQKSPGRLNCSPYKSAQSWWDYEVDSFAELSKPMPTVNVSKSYLIKSTFNSLFA